MSGLTLKSSVNVVQVEIAEISEESASESNGKSGLQEPTLKTIKRHSPSRAVIALFLETNVKNRTSRRLRQFAFGLNLLSILQNSVVSPAQMFFRFCHSIGPLGACGRFARKKKESTKNTAAPMAKT